MTDTPPVRVRIAPSPTGYLHLGIIRAALFNYLFAKKENGKFIIRIEDTDIERSLPIYEKDILDGFKALHINWDEGPDIGGDYGPYRQSERVKIYKQHLEKMLSLKKAYWCFCTKEELEEERKAMMSAGLFPKYSGKCRNLNEEEIRLIKEYKAQDRNFGYNIEAGGGCFSQSIETRQKISESLKGNKRRLGIKHTEETKKQLSKSHKGIKCSESTKDKLSKLKKGVKRSSETCVKIGNASRGRKLSDSAKEKLRIFNTGRVLSEESKRKISESQKGKN